MNNNIYNGYNGKNFFYHPFYWYGNGLGNWIGEMIFIILILFPISFTLISLFFIIWALVDVFKFIKHGVKKTYYIVFPIFKVLIAIVLFYPVLVLLNWLLG